MKYQKGNSSWLLSKSCELYSSKSLLTQEIFFVELTLGYKKNHPTGGVIFEIF